MEMHYKHITLEERIKIETLRKEGYRKNEIAVCLKRHRSTIGRELEKNFEGVGGVYRAKQAQKRKKMVREKANVTLRKLKPGGALSIYIEKKMKCYWSPEQIAGRLKKKHRGKTVISHETIYQYIYHHQRDLLCFLRHGHKRHYRRRYGTKLREKRREEAKKKRIDERPKIVETRSRIGDWEGDTIVGGEKTVHLLTHADRKSGLLLLNKLSTATAEHTRRVVTQLFSKIPKHKRHTITYDNGTQFSQHEALSRDIKTDIYFAHPYHSWERGTNENVNGLVRQFFPKRSFFKQITSAQIRHLELLINTRPRKRLGYSTPQEVF